MAILRMRKSSGSGSRRSNRQQQQQQQQQPQPQPQQQQQQQNRVPLIFFTFLILYTFSKNVQNIHNILPTLSGTFDLDLGSVVSVVSKASTTLTDSTTTTTVVVEDNNNTASSRVPNRTILPKLISPGNHTHILGPGERIGPNGELGFVRHDPTFLLQNPVPFQIRDEERDLLCRSPGEGEEQPEGARNLKKIRDRIEQHSTEHEPPNVNLFCAVYIHSGGVNHTTAISETWGKKCDGMMFASDHFSNVTGHIRLPTKSRFGFGYSGMTQRTRAILAYLYDNFLNEYDYFHIAGDDIYLLVENLKEFLASDKVQNWEQVADRYLLAGFWMNWGSTDMPQADGYFYLGGGSGYTLSRKALKAFVEGPLQTCLVTEDKSWEDVWFTDCARRLSRNQAFIDTRDDVGAHRYHQFNVQGHATFPKTYYGMDGTKKKPGAELQIVWNALLNMNRQYGFPLVYQDSYISASSIVFHKVLPRMLRRYELLLYGDRNLTNCRLLS